MKAQLFRAMFAGCQIALAAFFLCDTVKPQTPCDINYATIEAQQNAREISTAELETILAAKSAVVFDARPAAEYAISHIPEALNVAAKPGMPISMYVSDVAEITRLVNGEKKKAIVLYCNGPFCGKSKRLAAELAEAGFTNVTRYQLGIPIWRALGHVTEVELEGVRHIYQHDSTAVFIDARDAVVYAKSTIARARNLPQSRLKPGKDVGEVKTAKDDGRLPMNDHNTRIIVFGERSEQAHAVADAIAKEAFHNVSYFAGSFESLRRALE